MSDPQREIEKMRFQIRELCRCIDTSSMLAMIIEFDWGQEELQHAENIFRKYEPLSRNSDSNDWASRLRAEFESEFGIGHQGMKIVIQAFFPNSLWRNICIRYAHIHSAIEIDHIKDARFGQDPDFA